MGDIIDFRSRKKYPADAESALIINRLNNLQNALRDVYKHIEDGWESMQIMETEAEKVEKAYDEVLCDLSDVMGAENIPVEFLEYSKNVRVDCQEDGSFKLVWEPNQDFHIVFTPEED